MDQGSLAGSKAAARRDRIHAANSAPVCGIRAAWNGSNRVGGITTVFREHYKQLGSPGVRRVRRGQPTA
jgi:hypothetical protein